MAVLSQICHLLVESNAWQSVPVFCIECSQSVMWCHIFVSTIAWHCRILWSANFKI